jgi:hypothetical protein
MRWKITASKLGVRFARAIAWSLIVVGFVATFLPPRMMLAGLQTVHSVVQDDLVYCRVTALSKTSAGEPPARDSVSAYDGEKTRSVEYSGQ